MGFIILVIARAGYKGNSVPGGSLDGIYLNAIVSFAFFFIVLVQLIGILLGDKTPISVSATVCFTDLGKLNLPIVVQF
jgi:hypothetical protein